MSGVTVTNERPVFRSRDHSRPIRGQFEAMSGVAESERLKWLSNLDSEPATQQHLRVTSSHWPLIGPENQVTWILASDWRRLNPWPNNTSKSQRGPSLTESEKTPVIFQRIGPRLIVCQIVERKESKSHDKNSFVPTPAFSPPLIKQDFLALIFDQPPSMSNKKTILHDILISFDL